jgi:hypothetical protein
MVSVSVRQVRPAAGRGEEGSRRDVGDVTPEAQGAVQAEARPQNEQQVRPRGDERQSQARFERGASLVIARRSVGVTFQFGSNSVGFRLDVGCTFLVPRGRRRQAHEGATRTVLLTDINSMQIVYRIGAVSRGRHRAGGAGCFRSKVLGQKELGWKQLRSWAAGFGISQPASGTKAALQETRNV